MDTPGIGGSGEVTKKLMDYLPNAVSFIFVINVGSAGGMQNDRVSMLYQPSYNFTFKLKYNMLVTIKTYTHKQMQKPTFELH